MVWKINSEPSLPESSEVVIREWRDKDGYLHRENGPAVMRSDGVIQWWTHGSLHRDDGPAVIRHDGRVEFWKAGLLHRIGGPAVITPNNKEYWVAGERRSSVPGPDDDFQPGDPPARKPKTVDTGRLYRALIKHSVLEELGLTEEKFSELYPVIGWDYSENLLKNQGRYLAAMYGRDPSKPLTLGHFWFLSLAREEFKGKITEKQALELGDVVEPIVEFFEERFLVDSLDVEEIHKEIMISDTDVMRAYDKYGSRASIYLTAIAAGASKEEAETMVGMESIETPSQAWDAIKASRALVGEVKSK